jgi:hypothetical protein
MNQKKPIAEQDQEIHFREKRSIKLRDRITELSRHIAVIKRMFPTSILVIMPGIKSTKIETERKEYLLFKAGSLMVFKII